MITCGPAQRNFLIAISIFYSEIFNVSTILHYLGAAGKLVYFRRRRPGEIYRSGAIGVRADSSMATYCIIPTVVGGFRRLIGELRLT
jgi:hypothetical protein